MALHAGKATGGAATSVGAGAFPLLAPDGSAAAPSYANSTGKTGVYFGSGEILDFTTNQTAAGSINASQKWTIQPSGSTQTCVINGAALQLISATKDFRDVGGTNDSYTQYQGGASTDTGAFIRLYGSTHGTPELIQFYNSTASLRGSIDANGKWTLGTAAGTQTHAINGAVSVSAGTATQLQAAFNRYANAGDGTGACQVRIGNSGTTSGFLRFDYTNAAAAGAPTSQISHTPRNNADGSNTDAAVIKMYKVAATDGGEMELQTATSGGTLRNFIAATQAQVVTIGHATSLGRHVLNAGVATNGAVALTTLNGPTGTTGNPTLWVTISIAGTTGVFPVWGGA